jgi:hypothetical protein
VCVGAHCNVLEDTVAVALRELRLVRPRDAEALLEEEAFEHEEFLAYWAGAVAERILRARLRAARARHLRLALDRIGWIWWVAQWPVLIGGLLLAFGLVYAIGPNRNRRRGLRPAAVGALVAVAVWLAASGAFALYASEQLRPLQQGVGSFGAGAAARR